MILCFTAKGQVEYTDSLKLLLKNAKNDTMRCNLLARLAEAASDEEWPGFNEQLKKLAEKNLSSLDGNNSLSRTYTRYYANAINNEGALFQGQGDNQKALARYRQGLEINKKIDYRPGMATSINNIGSIYERNGNGDSAISCYIESAGLSHGTGDLSGEANSLSNIGSILYSRGDINAALNYFEKSLKICEKINDEMGISLSLSKMGLIFYDQGEDDKAIEYWKKCLAIREKLGFTQGAAEIANGIGMFYFNQKKIDVALNYFEKSFALNKSYGNKQGMASSLLSTGTIYKYKKEFDKALGYLQRSLALIEEIDNKDLQSSVLIKISDVYVMQNKLDEALTISKKAMAIALELKYPKEIRDASESLAQIYRAKGNYKEAFDNQLLFIKMRDSISNIQTRKSAIRSRLKYEYEKKAIADSVKTANEKKIFAVVLKQERTNTYLLLLSLVLVILIGFIVFQRNRNGQKQKVLHLRNKIASDLHDDIGSALSSIKLFAGMAKLNPVKAIDANVIDKIEVTSSETIENMSDIVWSINPKNDNILFVLEKMRYFGENICNSVNIDFAFFNDTGIDKLVLDIEQRKNLFLIYKEAINNAVKYSQAKEIKAELKRKNKTISVRIADNGIGINAEKINNGNGIGNMKQRAADINGVLTIETAEGNGTIIQLEFKTT